MTPQELREIAVAKDQEGKAAIERGDAEAAAVAYHQANTARAAASRMEAMGGKSLPPAPTPRNVNSNVNTLDRGVAISEGRTDPENELGAMARAAGYSMRRLAKAAGISPALLTMANAGERAMPARSAKLIQKLTGFPMDRWRSLS